jgi:hypothetical protein
MRAPAPRQVQWVRLRPVRNRLSLITLAFVIVAVPWLACVGDDPGSDAIDDDGKEGGKCFGNGTCIPGLTCLSDRCVRVSGPDAGPTDGSTSADDAARDGSSSDADASDGAVPCDAGITPAPIPTNVRCGDAGSFGCPRQSAQVCCGGGQGCVTKTNCQTASQPVWECEVPNHCGVQGTRCCMYPLTLDPTQTCPLKASGSPQSECTSLCVNAPFLCEKTADCKDAGICTPVEVRPTGNNSSFVVGACLPVQ